MFAPRDGGGKLLKGVEFMRKGGFFGGYGLSGGTVSLLYVIDIVEEEADRVKRCPPQKRTFLLRPSRRN